MNILKTTKVWFLQMRAGFIILTIFLAAIGFALVVKFPAVFGFGKLRAGLIFLGLVCAHISVNLFNEYFDFRSKIDSLTNRTPFSGGSGMLVKGLTKASHVCFIAVITLVIALGTGIYLSMVAHWFLMVYIIIGLIAILFYTDVLTRFFVGELFAGLCLGFLVVTGTYIGMTAKPGLALSALAPMEVWLTAIIPGLLTMVLLLLNQFPDVDADKKGGRRHLVITLGYRNASVIFVILWLIIYLLAIFLPLLNLVSSWMYLATLSLPITIRTCLVLFRKKENIVDFLPALGMNTVAVLLTDALIALAVVLSI